MRLGEIIKDKEVNKDSVQEDVNKRILPEGKEISDLKDKIIWWKNSPFDDFDQAKQYLDDNFSKLKYFYQDEHFQIAVIFKEIKANEETISKTIQFNKILNEYYDYSKMRFTPKTFTCFNCESSINKDYFIGNKCPVCGTNLKNLIETSTEEMRAKVDKAKKEFEEVKNNPKNYNLKWLIMFEYHYQE